MRRTSDSMSNSTNLNIRVDGMLKQEAEKMEKLLKLGKDLNKINVVIGKLANNEELDAK